MVDDPIFLEELIDRRRLSAATAQASTLHDRHFCCPIRTPTHAVHCDAALVDLRTRLRIVDNLRKHTVRSLADLDRVLPSARTIDGQISNAKGKDRAETFCEVFLAAVEAVDRDYEGHRSLCFFGQAQIADDFFALERNL